MNIISSDLATTLLRIGGVLHLCLLTAAAQVPSKLDFRGQLKMLNPMLRQLVWVYALYIFMVITAFGIGSLVFAHTLSLGTPLARAICGFIGFFWIVRMLIQLVLFDAKPHLTNALYRIGYHCLTVAFTYLAIAYTVVAICV